MRECESARGIRVLLSALAFVLLSIVAPGAAEAQAGSCILQQQSGPFQILGPPESRVISASGPLLVTCDGGEELRADSAVIYELQNEVHLFRRVDFKDPTRALTSDQAIYNSATGRLYATGNVVFTDRTRGSTLRGPELEYFRAQPGRPESQSIATGRPHLTVVPKARDDGKRRDPMEVDGDRITSVGDRTVSAEGNVVIVSGEARSTASTAVYDNQTEHLELLGGARVTNPDYDLTGERIDSELEGGSLEQVVSRTNARLVSERLTLTGPELRLYFQRDSLQRVVSAAGGTTGEAAKQRSIALSRGFRLEGDSIEAQTPGQKIREVHAVGRARGEAWDTLPPPRAIALADSARGDSAAVAAPAPALRSATEPPANVEERDLLLADTIIGYLRQDTVPADSARPAAPGDTTAATREETRLERMVAIGNAQSLYRMQPEKDAPPGSLRAINYLVADRVTLAFEAGEVDTAHVLGLKRGVYLDPKKPGQAEPAGSAQPGQPGTATPPAAVVATPSTPAPGRRP